MVVPRSEQFIAFARIDLTGIGIASALTRIKHRNTVIMTDRFGATPQHKGYPNAMRCRIGVQPPIGHVRVL